MQPKAYSYIRFSSPEQAQGDSLRRQVSLAEEYAKKNSLVLDDSLRLQDMGLSAFSGAHRTKGALGEFLRQAKEGQIPKGSILIVESLDRLSREQVGDALAQFTSIIQAGIHVVTLQDGMRYGPDTLNENWSQLIVSIAFMARAHEESRAKSERLRQVWAAKRTNEKEKLTSRAPAWLKLSEDRTEFFVIPERAEAIELIFRLKSQGFGKTRIERTLNSDPTIWKPEKSGRNQTGGWRASYIQKILRNRAVIGEFQPHRMVNGKRQPVGDPIPDYYPVIVDPDLFHSVQAQIDADATKKGNGGGRRGKASNLFTHIIKCGRCGSSMHYIDKGKPPKGGQYLHCDASRRLRTCSANAVRYDEFEQLFFREFEELDITRLMPNQDEVRLRLNKLEQRKIASHQKARELESQIENLTDSIALTSDSRIRTTLEARLSKTFDKLEALQTETVRIEKEIEQTAQQKDQLQSNIDQAKEVYELLGSSRNEHDRINMRLRLRQEIRRLVKRIEVYPLQEAFNAVQETEEPGIVKLMASRYMDKVRIKFRGSYNMRVLYLKRYAERVE